jgi:hypothetical protein
MSAKGENLRYTVEKRDGAYMVVDTETGDLADGPYPPLEAKRKANLLDKAWAEGKAGKLNAMTVPHG